MALIYQKKECYLLYNHLEYHIQFHYHDSETILQKPKSRRGLNVKHKKLRLGYDVKLSALWGGKRDKELIHTIE